MTIKASGHPVLIFATGLFMCFAAPSQAAASADAVAAGSPSETAGVLPGHPAAKASARHLKKHAHRKSSKVAHTSSDGEKPDQVSVDGGAPAAALPASVANANAQLASADTPAGNARAMTARANDILQTAPSSPWQAQPAPQTDVISPDQLNDIDRALHESAPPVPTIAMAAADAPAPAPAKPVAATTSESSAWDQTSLIGKIFIGFGALLTVASAARMFMA
ncbi:MAG: hypothetical protein NVS2B1_07170 [Bradyrhizobium sp.]